MTGKVLWVCWQLPDRTPGENPLLSFLSPVDHERACDLWKGPVIEAVEASREIRKGARTTYLNLVADIGLARVGEKTFRETMALPGETSRWWYHLTSFKDCEEDPAFDYFIALLTIESVVDRLGIDRLVLYAAPQPLARVLKSRFSVEEHETVMAQSRIGVWLRGLASRLVCLTRTSWQAIFIGYWQKIPPKFFDAVCFGFWDYSVYWDDQSSVIRDKYFKDLIPRLKEKGFSSIGWLVWYDPLPGSGKSRWPSRESLVPDPASGEIFLLQGFLGVKDVFLKVLDFRPLWIYLKVRGQETFRKVFIHRGFDCFPIFEKSMLYYFLHFNIPHCELMALATQRAIQRTRPKMALSFQEHFTHSRAHYEGLRRSGVRAVSFVMQHAGFNQEKTFLFLHPLIEFQGKSDGQAVPCPDYVCVMGTLGQELFLECGYPPERVLLTGSPRYDHVRAVSSEVLVSKKGKYRFLMVCSRDVESRLDFIEAVVAATQGIDRVNLYLRKFISSQIEENPQFVQYRDRITITKGTLIEDLEMADLVLFTFSTVAEEAFFMGKPVWQWAFWRFNGSVIAQVFPVPQFSSVAKLRAAILDFIDHPQSYQHPTNQRQALVERLFYRDDGAAAERMAQACVDKVGKAGPIGFH